MRTMVWFRGKDLRLADHAPICDAIAAGEVIPIFVIDPYFFAPERAREHPHRIQFLLESLASLAREIEARGSELVLVEGRSVELIPALAEKLRVERIVAHRWTEPFARERDERIRRALRVPFDLYEGETLARPGQVKTKGGDAYRVYTPFARAFSKTVEIDPPRATPRRIPALPPGLRVRRAKMPTLESLGVTRNARLLPGGEEHARARLRAFLAGPAAHYSTARDRLGVAGTSRLSQDLKFGTLSPRTVWTEVTKALEPKHHAELVKYCSELVWREFAYMLLWENPRLLTEPFDARFRRFPWKGGTGKKWQAWVEGETGYPVVDAAARQLFEEGYVHNRARMISASFLTRDLMIHYKYGEAHYLKWLTDGDWASNNMGWQWAAGCGSDPQPYFRIFNPVLQGERFDADGAYVRRYLPELARLPDRYIHAPWKAPPAALKEAGVVLGQTYPRPIVDHREAQARFLEVAREHLGRTR